jgi:hypothetical protein
MALATQFTSTCEIVVIFAPVVSPASPSRCFKKTISGKLGIPVLVLEGDLYDSRNYSAEQLGTRVESFAGMLKMARVARRT